MKWLDDIVKGLSDKVKKIIVAAIIGLVGIGGGGGSYLVFAKNADFQIHLAQHSIKDMRKEIRLLEGLMKEYRDDYGKDLSGATDKQKDIYKDWEYDLDDSRDKLKAAKEKAQG